MADVNQPHAEKPEQPAKGFGDLRLKEAADAEKMSKDTVGSGFAELNKSPEALAATREQMIREQLNKAANLVVAFYKNSGDLQHAGISEKDLKQKVMASQLFVQDIGVILRDAYTRQDEKNPHAYDNEYTLPYVVQSDDDGLMLRASPELKREKWQDQLYDLNEYKGDFFEKEEVRIFRQTTELTAPIPEQEPVKETLKNVIESTDQILETIKNSPDSPMKELFLNGDLGNFSAQFDSEYTQYKTDRAAVLDGTRAELQELAQEPPVDPNSYSKIIYSPDSSTPTQPQ